jgi:hypothetical protein
MVGLFHFKYLGTVFLWCDTYWLLEGVFSFDREGVLLSDADVLAMDIWSMGWSGGKLSMFTLCDL